MSPLIYRQGDGSFAIDLPEHQRDLLRELAPTLRSDMLLGDPADARRLFPTVHPDDPDAEAAYQDLARDQLLESRLTALDVLEEKADAEVLSEEELVQWMQAVNSIRLIIGTRLNITDDHAEEAWDLSPDEPETPERITYHYLSILLEHIVGALHATLPDPSS